MMESEVCQPVLPQENLGSDRSADSKERTAWDCPSCSPSNSNSNPPQRGHIHQPTKVGLGRPGHFGLIDNITNESFLLQNSPWDWQMLSLGTTLESELSLCLIPTYSLTLHTYGPQDHFLINILHTKFHLRLCFLKNPTWEQNASYPIGDTKLRAWDEVENGSTKERN